MVGEDGAQLFSKEMNLIGEKGDRAVNESPDW